MFLKINANDPSISSVCVYFCFFFSFFISDDHRSWVNEPPIADHYEFRCFGLSIQFNAFLVCSLFIPSQCHLCLLLTVFGCHEWWWIRINKVLRPSDEMNGVWVNSLVLSSSLVTQGSCQWINHDSDSSRRTSKMNYAVTLSIRRSFNWIKFRTEQKWTSGKL